LVTHEVLQGCNTTHTHLRTEFEKVLPELLSSIHYFISQTTFDIQDYHWPTTPEQLIGFQGSLTYPDCLMIKHDNIHIEIQFDAKHDLLGNGQFHNSQTGIIYILKPKMYGPEKVAFAQLLFLRAETILDLPLNTIKMALMDEERRTNLNLQVCIAEAKTV
jgi:hypothetical protein